MFTTASRKRHRSVSSSSPEDSSFQPSTESSSAELTRQPSRSASPHAQHDSDFESLPAHLVNEAPSRKRRRKNAPVAGTVNGKRPHGRPEPFIRTGFESMALESDGEDGYPAQNGPFPRPGYPAFGEQQEEFMDETPPITSRDFAFQHNMNPGFYDTYRTRDAAELDVQGDTLVMNDADVVQPQSVEMPTPDQEFPPSLGRRWTAREPVIKEAGDAMVEDVSDPEAGGRRKGEAKAKGKTWYEPEKDRIVVTSLSDTESERGSPEPISSPIDLSSTTDEVIELPPADRLTQPGSRGFTIHPTLLNRLNRMSEAERSRLPFPPAKYNQTQERGLILYRTPGRTFDGVRRNNGMESDDEDEDAADRFQVLSEDGGVNGDAEMMVEQDQDDGVAGMEDVEVDQSGIMEEVDSMEIG